jgi:type IV pilus assembly protein PilO
MTNLQQGAPTVDPRQLRRLWVGLPIAAGGLLAALLTAVVVVPLGSAVQRESRRLEELQELRDQVPLLRRQLSSLAQAEEKAQRQQTSLFELVSGSGDLSTYLSALDQEARAAGVTLQLFEPQPEAASAQAREGARPSGAGREAPAGRQGEAARGTAATAAEPGAALLDVEGLQRRSVLLAARGPFPALLRFLRGLEARDVLVVQSDLQMALEEAAGRSAADPQPVNPVVLRLTMSLYEKQARAGQTGAGAPAPAATGRPAPR